MSFGVGVGMVESSVGIWRWCLDAGLTVYHWQHITPFILHYRNLKVVANGIHTNVANP